LKTPTGNWGPALKEWGLSAAKKTGTRTEGVGLSAACLTKKSSVYK